jgi:hypothetical protein
MSPRSGMEPVLNLAGWNKISNLKNSHNCFSYAMNTVDKVLMNKCNETPECNVGTPQPGYASGHGEFSNDHEKGCSDMVSRLIGDNYDIKYTEFENKCPNNTSKIALIVDPKRDYHFLRQDSNGYWSHKPGSMDVTTKDASKRPILRPDLAYFTYKHKDGPLAYTKFCGYYCVPRGKPLFVEFDSKQDGGSKNVLLPSRGSTRYQLTRKKSRGVRQH